LSKPPKRSSGLSASGHQSEAISWVNIDQKVIRDLLDTAKNLPLSGNCPRNLPKDRLKECLSFGKGTTKDGSARSEAMRVELPQRDIKIAIFLTLIITAIA